MLALLTVALVATPAPDTRDPAVTSYEQMRLGLCAPKPLPDTEEYALVEAGIVAVPCAGMPLELIEWDELYLRLGDEETAETYDTYDKAALGLYIGGAALGVAAAGTLLYGGPREAEWSPALPFSLFGGAVVSIIVGYFLDHWRKETPHDTYARIEAHNAELRADLNVVDAGDEIELMRAQLHHEVAIGAPAQETADLTAHIEAAEELERRSIAMRRHFITRTYACGPKMQNTCTSQAWEDPRPHLGSADEPLEWDRFYEIIGREDIVDDNAWRRVTKNVGWGTALAGTAAVSVGLVGAARGGESDVPWGGIAIAGATGMVVGGLVGWLFPTGDYADTELAEQLTEEYNARLRTELEGQPAPPEEPSEEPTDIDDDDEDWNA